MSTLQVPTARVFKPLLQPSRYKGAHGGRGSGKSQFFAGEAVKRCYRAPGTSILCVREVQKSLEQSAMKLIKKKIAEFGLSQHFDVLKTHIETPGGGVIAFQGMQDHTADSVKSFEDFDVAWVEEAQTLSQHSLTLLRPTIRKPGSELWFGWNRRRRQDPVNELLTGGTPPLGTIVVNANWRDNPWFPQELQLERLGDQRDRPDEYDHVWEGDYVKVVSGAYYAKQLTAARNNHQLTTLARDPLMTVWAVWDIGGTGRSADACAIWVMQLVGPQIRFLDYYEAQGQPLAAHVNWLQDNGYSKAHCVLPHDGVKHDFVYDVTYESALKKAGFDVTVIPNQGRGAALKRVEVARRMFPNIWFDQAKTSGGVEAISAYHERKDQVRGIGLGPEHDWASHGADAFGLACVFASDPPAQGGWGSSLGRQRTRVV